METKKTHNFQTFIFGRDRIFLLNYLVKFLVFEGRGITSGSKITKNSFFFNRVDLVKRLKLIKKKLIPNIIYKNTIYYNRKKINKIKFFKKIKLFKKKFDLRNSKFLLAGQLHSI
jgi:hypothetical protein